MTDTDTDPEYYVIGRYQAQVLHQDGDCQYLEGSDKVRPALPHEVDQYAECSWCTQTVDIKGKGEGHQKSLRDAAQEDTE